MCAAVQQPLKLKSFGSCDSAALLRGHKVTAGLHSSSKRIKDLHVASPAMGAGALTFTYGMKTTQREREIMVNYTLNISHNAFIGAMKDQELPPSAY